MAISNFAMAADAAHRSTAATAYTLAERTPESAVSWGAIVAGAAAAAALSLILLLLGTGLGLSSVSPWASQGASAAVVGLSAIVWLTLTQILASGMGGYIAGRLRTDWDGVHGDEVYFRDTAHGFLAWAVASLLTAALLTSVIGSILGSGVQAGAAITGGAAKAATALAADGTDVADRAPGAASITGYLIDSMFRKDASAAALSASEQARAAALSSTPTNGHANGLGSAQASTAQTAESVRILFNALRAGALPIDDQRFLAQAVAQRSGLAQPEAEKRVVATFARLQAKQQEVETAAREAADKARKASAYSALWLFISLLVGAFVASLAATYGGRQRRA